MSKKLTQQEALNIMASALDIAIQKGAFSRKEVVTINDAIEVFEQPQELTAAKLVDNDLPKDPSKP